MPAGCLKITLRSAHYYIKLDTQLLYNIEETIDDGTNRTFMFMLGKTKLKNKHPLFDDS